MAKCEYTEKDCKFAEEIPTLKKQFEARFFKYRNSYSQTNAKTNPCGCRIGLSALLGTFIS